MARIYNLTRIIGRLLSALILLSVLLIMTGMSMKIIAYAESQLVTTIYVPQDYPTIQAAIDAAQDGETIVVAPGVYTENILISGKSITLASQYIENSDPNFIDQTIIDGGNAAAETILIETDAGPATTVLGFTIRNGSDGIHARAKANFYNNRFIANGDGIDYENNSGGECFDNVFEFNSDDGIDLDGAVSAEIRGNYILNNGGDGLEIRLHAYSGPILQILIEENVITQNGSDGIQLIDYPDLSDRVFTIQKNLITNNDQVGLGLMDNGETNEDYRAASIPERINLINNTFSGNLYGVTGGDNLIALNNLFLDTVEIALKEVDGGETGSIAAYNLFWNNLVDHSGSNIDPNTTIYSNPMLDSSCMLMEGSPAIDSGTAYFEWNGEAILDLTPLEYSGTAPDLGWNEKDFNQPSPTPSLTATSGPSPTPTPIVTAIEVRVGSGTDDAEENLSGSVDVNSSDLEMTFDIEDQIVGMRFNGVVLSPGVTITHAYLHFQVDEATSVDTNLTITGEASDYASTFQTNLGNISSRPRTSAVVEWSPPPWNVVGSAGADQRTSDISQIIQEIIDRPGWSSGNPLVLIISGSGKRVAESYDGLPGAAPLLHVEYAGTPMPTPTPTITPTPFPAGEYIRFAVIGDYGEGSSDEARVATQVASWNPDFVITTGDNNYSTGSWETIDPNIGQFYSQFIGNYVGIYGPGADENQFWPSLGNHDWLSLTCTDGTCAGPYFDYFTLPGNERYYTIDYGLVRLFAIDSDYSDPDGNSESSLQARWLQDTLAISTACYNVVYFHHAPYSSGRHGSSSIMQWPFQAWGADVVLSGHDHTYERIDAGNFPYFVNGAGGSSLYTFDNLGTLPVGVTSEFRYNDDFGAMQVLAGTSGITYQFINSYGVLIDEFTVEKSCSLTPTATQPGPSLTPEPSASPTPTNTPQPPTPTEIPTITSSPTDTPQFSPTPTPSPTPTSTTTSQPPSVLIEEVRVVSGEDDAEESDTGSMYITSSDLELVNTNGYDQVVGVRFTGMQVPQGATISSAYVQFKVEDNSSIPTHLLIQGQLTGDSPVFSTSSGDISSRSRTTAFTTWDPAPWEIIGEVGLDQRTPDISSIIQEITGHPDWTAGNSLSIIITGSGVRVAESFNGDPPGAPLLHVEFMEEGGVSTPTPTATPVSSNTPTPTNSPSPTATATDTPTPSSTSSPTATSTDTPAPSSTPTPTATATIPPASSSTPTPTATETQTPSSTPSPTATPTVTPTSTSTTTPTPTDTPTPSSTPTLTATNTQVANQEQLYISISSTKSNDVGSAANVSDEDILVYDGADFSLFFDGSDVSLDATGVDAFFLIEENTLLISLNKPISLPGVGDVDDSDILQFTAAVTGENTYGTWMMYFDSSDVDLSAPGEDINAFALLPDGRLLISTMGNFTVPGVSGHDEDILVFSAASLGSYTAGTWDMYFDGSDIGLSDDIDGIDIGLDGEIHLSVSRSATLANLTANDEDVFTCIPLLLGDTTNCNINSTLYFNGNTWGLSDKGLDAFSIY